MAFAERIDSVSQGDTDTLIAGRYQGVHSRRVARYLMAICLGPILVHGNLQSRPIRPTLYGWAVTLAIIAICDLWFSRRMGLTIDERGITLHYAFHRKRVPWSRITGFEWRRWNDPRSEWIWITRSHGSPVRIPALQRPPGGNNTGFWSPVHALLASSNLRSRDGDEVNAMQTLQEALAARTGRHTAV